MSDLRILNESLARKAHDELNENPNDVDYYLNALRTWAQQQTHFRSRTNDQFLIAFLRAGKFSLEKAKRKLENYYIYRPLMPEIFRNRDLTIPNVRKISLDCGLVCLPQPVAPDGPRVLMLRPKYFDLKQYNLIDVFKLGTMGTEILLHEDDNVIVAGYILIMDLANVPKSTVLCFDPNFARKLTIIANKCVPTRMKGFHFMNVPHVFEKFFGMVKSVINVKLRERFYVHGSNYESLYEHIPRHILPKEYGGDCDIVANELYWWNKLNAYKDLFKEDEEYYGPIENACKKSYGQSNFFKECQFGVDGSFRKLNID